MPKRWWSATFYGIIIRPNSSLRPAPFYWALQHAIRKAASLSVWNESNIYVCVLAQGQKCLVKRDGFVVVGKEGLND